MYLVFQVLHLIVSISFITIHSLSLFSGSMSSPSFLHEFIPLVVYFYLSLNQLKNFY